MKFSQLTKEKYLVAVVLKVFLIEIFNIHATLTKFF